MRRVAAMSPMAPPSRGVPVRGRTLLACVLLAGAVPAAALRPSAVAAQEAPPRVLSLDEAMSVARNGNPALQRSLNSIDLNGAEFRSTWANQLLPSARLTLFQTAFTGNLTRRAFDDFGNPVENPAADWNYFSQTVHNLGLSWGFQGASLFQSHRRQGLTNLDRTLASEVAVTDLDIAVRRLYRDAQEQRDLLALEEELIEARTTDLDVAERLFRLAGRTRVDVLNAELEIERQSLVRQQQEAAFERALLALRTALGLPDGEAIAIADEPLALFDPTGFDAERLISRALDVNPTIGRSELAIRSAELGVSEQRTNWWPEVRVGVDVYRRAFEPAGAALFDPSIGTDLESQFFINFSIPALNNVFGQRLEQQRAGVELANQRETDREARLQLAETIRGALLDLENQWEAYRITERSRVIAEEALRLAREEYRLGTRTFEDLRSSFQQEADTRRQLITARHSFVDALLTLEEAVGARVRPGSN